jgi:hypothetical protein
MASRIPNLVATALVAADKRSTESGAAPEANPWAKGTYAPVLDF